MEGTKAPAAPMRAKPGDLYLTCGGTIIAHMNQDGRTSTWDLAMFPVAPPVHAPEEDSPACLVEHMIAEGVDPRQVHSAVWHRFPEADTLVTAARVLYALSVTDGDRYPFEGLELRMSEDEDPRLFIGNKWGFVRVTGMDKSQATMAIVSALAELPGAPGWPAPGTMDQATVHARVESDNLPLLTTVMRRDEVEPVAPIALYVEPGSGTVQAEPEIDRDDPAMLARTTLKILEKFRLADRCRTSSGPGGDTYLHVGGNVANIEGTSPASIVCEAIEMSMQRPGDRDDRKDALRTRDRDKRDLEAAEEADPLNRSWEDRGGSREEGLGL